MPHSRTLDTQLAMRVATRNEVPCPTSGDVDLYLKFLSPSPTLTAAGKGTISLLWGYHAAIM